MTKFSYFIKNRFSKIIQFSEDYFYSEKYSFHFKDIMFQTTHDLDAPDFFNDYEISFIYDPLLKLSLDDLYFPCEIEDYNQYQIKIPEFIYEDNDNLYSCDLLPVDTSEQNNRFIDVFREFLQSSHYLNKFIYFYAHIDALSLAQAIAKIAYYCNPKLCQPYVKHYDYFNINNKVKMITYDSQVIK